MEINFSVASKNKQNKNKGNLLWMIFFMFLFIIFGGLWWKKESIKKQNILLQTSIENIKKQLHQKKGEKTITNVFESQRILTEAQKYRINWSTIMRNILVYETNGIEFDNFSISNEKNISVNAKASSLILIKKLLSTLMKHKKIKMPFVSSISEKDNGQIHFQLSFQFIE